MCRFPDAAERPNDQHARRAGHAGDGARRLILRFEVTDGPGSPGRLAGSWALLLSCVHTRPSCAAAAARMLGQAGEPRWGRTKRGQVSGTNGGCAPACNLALWYYQSCSLEGPRRCATAAIARERRHRAYGWTQPAPSPDADLCVAILAAGCTR